MPADNWHAAVGRMLLNGTPVTKIVQQFPQSALLYTTMCQISEAYFKDLMVPTHRYTGDTLPNQWAGLVLPFKDPSHKKRHYWIYSNCSDKGKTTFLKAIERSFPSQFCTYAKDSLKTIEKTT